MSTATQPKRKRTRIEFHLDPSGEFDELWMRDAFVHVERMDETSFWIGIEGKEGHLHIRTGVHRGRWYFNVQDVGTIKGEHHSVERPRRSAPKGKR